MNNKMRRCVLLAVLAAACLIVCSPQAGRAWWGDSYKTPSLGGTWGTATDCGTYWYAYMLNTSCAGLGKSATFDPGFQWNGRGYIAMDWVDPGAYALIGLRLRYRNQAGGLPGTYFDRDGCAFTCAWRNVLGGETGDMYNWNGVYMNGNEAWTTGCGSACGVKAGAVRELHMWGDKWVYLNDWIVFGGYGSGSISDTANRSFPWAESGLYAYPAVDTSRGTYVRDTLYGSPRTPFRVQTGDCGNAGLGNYLNFKGNASNGNNNNCDNCDAYAFAWVYAPSGAGPQFGIGSDDGVRVWLNGNLFWDNNASRGVTWDQDRTAAQSMSAGWNRILFKVHNGGGGFGGVMSLHNGGDFRQMEPSVSLQSDRYGGYSVGYEQDDWYPRIDVASFEGVSNPQPDTDVYTNDTTINVSGTASVTGPVPLWTVLQYQWGYGISGNTNDAQVSTPGASWSHSQTGVTGHRRFHFFSVSRSGRLSIQNNGKTGGSNWADGTGGNYIDVFVDNVAPQNPTLAGVTGASTSQINLTWAIPLDQGVNIAAGSTEDANAGGTYPTNTNHYRRGDVGVQVYRNGNPIYTWGTGTSKDDTGLSANTQYAYTIEARDNSSQSRGAWANYTGQQGSVSRYTLQVNTTTPSFSNIGQTGLTVTTSGPVNLAAGSSGVVFNRNGSDLAKVQTLSIDETGLTPNANYVYTAKGVNGDNIATGVSGSNAAYTLAVPPSAGENIACDKSTGVWMKGGTAITFSNPTGFGTNAHGASAPYRVSKFRYAWNTSDSYTFDGSEAEWGTGSLVQTPAASGDYYLHVRSVNGDGAVTPVTLTFGPFKIDADAPSAGPAVSTTANSGGVTVNFTAGSDALSGLNTTEAYRVTRSGFDSGPLTTTAPVSDTAGDIPAGDVATYTITTKDEAGNTSSNTISARQIMTGTTWIYTTGAASMAAPGIIPYSEPYSPAITGVFAGSNDYRLHGMARDTGSMIITPLGTVNVVLDRTAPTRDFPNPPWPFVPPLNNAMVFASSLDGKVYASYPASNTQAWATQVSGSGYPVKVKPGGKLNVTLTAGPRSGQTVNLVVVGTYDNSAGNSFVALDMADGLVLWTTTPGNLGPVTGSPAVVGTTAYFTSYSVSSGPSVWAVDLQSGGVLWSRGEPGSISAAPAVSLDGSVIYVGSNTGTVYAYSTANGVDAALWTAALGDGAVVGAPWPAGGQVYVSTLTKVHRLNASTGSSAGSPWPVAVSAPSTPVVGGSGKLYVGSSGGNLVQIDTGTGTSSVKALGAGAGTLGDPVIGTDDGNVYVGAADGRIYKITAPF